MCVCVCVRLCVWVGYTLLFVTWLHFGFIFFHRRELNLTMFLREHLEGKMNACI